MTPPLRRALAAEALGTLLLVATVVGSGVMAERLAGGNAAIALLGNTIATGAVLYVLITILAPWSGAHFNPAVTLFVARPNGWAGYLAAQLAGGVAGVLLVHAMFDLPIIQLGVKPRSGIGQAVGEFVATFGLALLIVIAAAHRRRAIPALVSLWIVAGYWFTSSTSFANPAVTIARALTDSFAGLRPVDVPAFVLAQCVGAATGAASAAGFFALPPRPCRAGPETADAQSMGHANPLAPGHNCWRIERADRASVVVDAENYYRAAREAMLTAKHQILLVGWDFDARIDLTLGDEHPEAPPTVGALITWLVQNRPGTERLHPPLGQGRDQDACSEA